MSLSSLPDVLCQSVMRMLDVPSILRLARCNHRLATLSSAPFVWAHSSLSVRCTPQELLRRFESTPSLQQLAELKFYWQAAAVAAGVNPRAYRYSDDESVAALLSALDRGSLCLVELHLDDLLHMRDLTPVLSAVRVRLHLRVLRGAALMLSSDVVDLMTRMPRLHTLATEDEMNDSSWLADLPRVPSLTDVTCFAGPDGADETRLPLLARCSGLRRLTLLEPRLSGSKFRHFFGSRYMRRLQFLCLRRLHSLVSHDAPTPSALDAEEAADPLPTPDQDELSSEAALDGLSAVLDADVWGDAPTNPADYIATFRRMHELTELQLVECYGIEQILTYVAHAPALQLLVIEPGLDGDYMDGCPSFPSAVGLLSLLAAAPDLRVVLRMPPKIPDEDSGHYSHITEMRSQLRGMFGEAGAAKQGFGPRFSLQAEDGYDPLAPPPPVGVQPPPVDPVWAALLAAAQANAEAAAAAAAAGVNEPQAAAAPAAQPGAGECKQQ